MPSVEQKIHVDFEKEEERQKAPQPPWRNESSHEKVLDNPNVPEDFRQRRRFHRMNSAKCLRGLAYSSGDDDDGGDDEDDIADDSRKWMENVSLS